ncbi:GTPase domain containing protein, putative [Eimeria necatrix]|uniref:GTPase domain containing protein, putative n=1 Tax=Eimeria necatrix TaxID=51315 RepID=U6MEY8_9EIME|nr:GTPase domain containing protein, putative [Eimeria necatrix]CDJ62817.1 GTPase domain containing protein, putative [Eimeria necatrix]
MRKVAKNKDGPVRKSKMRLGAFIPIVAAGAAAAVTVLLLRWSSTAMFHLWLGPLGWLVAVAGAAAATSSVTAAAYGHSEFRRDPGIPNSYPFKAELLANIARQKQEREEQLQREREQRKQQKQQQRQQRQEQSEAAAAAVQADGATDAEALQRIADKAAAATTTFEAATAAGPSEADLALQSIASSLTLSSSKQQHVAALQRQQQQQLRQLLAASDIIIHVLDARLPLAFRCAGLERWALREGKKVILLLNKIDLLPAAALAAWLHHLQRSSACPVLAFKCSSSNSSSAGKRRGRWCAADPLHASDKLKRSSSHALGVQPLLKLLSSIAHAAAKPSRGAAAATSTAENDTVAAESGASATSSSSRPAFGGGSGSSKAFMTVGVVGYPNVGKSSVVNALTRSACTASVAALPGSTRQLKFIKLDSQTQLIDSPGVLFAPPAKEEDRATILPHPLSILALQQEQQQGRQLEKPLVASASVLLQSLLPVPQIPDPVAVAEALISISCIQTLQRLYHLPSFSNPKEALHALAMRRGKLLKGGTADIDAAAKMFLQGWQEGSIPYYSLPSGFRDNEPVRLVNKSDMEDEAIAALQQELADRQLAALGVTPAAASAPARGPEAEAESEDAQASHSGHGAMRLMFRDIAMTKRQREEQRAKTEASERMEHVAARQKQRKLEKKMRRGEAAAVSMEEDKATEGQTEVTEDF